MADSTALFRAQVARAELVLAQVAPVSASLRSLAAALPLSAAKSEFEACADDAAELARNLAEAISEFKVPVSP
jgi:hypothetical protein